MPSINVLNEIQIKQNGITTTYRVGTVNGYYNPTDGKFYLDSSHTTEIGGAPNLVYADIAANALYIYKTATSSFVNVSGGSGGGLVYGYLNETDGKFYEEDTYTTEIPGDNEKLFITLDTNYIYRYDSTDAEFVQIGGSGDGFDAIVYVTTLPTPPDIENVIYGATIHTAYTETIADGFLDDNDLFSRAEDPLTGGYIYTPAEGITLEASDDDTTYKDFSSLAYDGFADWTLTYMDGNYATLADGDDFYFKNIQHLFYAGNKEEQTLVSFSTGGSGGGGVEYFAGEGIRIDNNVISVIPATTTDLGGMKPDDSTIKIDMNGVVSGNYQGGYGIKITGNSIETKTFVGTQTEWDNLTSAQKAKFDTVSITDDFSTLNNTPGHTVIDTVGNEMPQRTKLKFADAVVTDDSTNDMSIVTHVPYTEGRKITINNYEIGCDDTVKGSFIGTVAEWNALNATDKAKYDIVNLTDDAATTSAVVDILQNGNMNAVTSNAVYDAIHNTNFTIDTLTIEDGATTVTEVNKTVNDITQYKFIIISIIANGTDDRINTVMIPKDLFKLVPSYYASAYQDILYGAAKYIDDTHIKVKCYNQTTGYGKMYVAGVK